MNKIILVLMLIVASLYSQHSSAQFLSAAAFCDLAGPNSMEETSRSFRQVLVRGASGWPYVTQLHISYNIVDPCGQVVGTQQVVHNL